MLSRIADSLFWLARYIERAEDTARILDVNYHMLLEQSPAVLPAALGAADHHGRRGGALPQALRRGRTPKTFSSFWPSGRTIPAPSCSASRKARENARTIRDRISREMWEDINGLYHMITRFNPQDEIAAGPHRFCDKIKFGATAFTASPTPRCRTTKAGSFCASAGRSSARR